MSVFGGDDRGRDEIQGAAPNCPRDLVPMALEGDGEHARWRCPECGLVSLAE